MQALVLDGRQLAEKIEERLRRRVAKLRRSGIVPGLGIIVRAHDQTSLAFVRRKEIKSAAIGIKTQVVVLTRQKFLENAKKQIAAWNADNNIHGIVVQIPSGHVSEMREAICEVAPRKDVDCLHPENIGLLSLSASRFVPPTPAGIHRLLLENKIKIEGKHVVIIGRGNLVGKPLALTLLQKNKKANATVTVCHRHTTNLAKHTKQADILVVAIGQREFIGKKYVKKGCVVVDVGIHFVGGKWFGDVKHDEVDNFVYAVTPVPGGVGPMTVIMLLQNVVQAAESFANTYSVPFSAAANK